MKKKILEGIEDLEEKKEEEAEAKAEE